MIFWILNSFFSNKKKDKKNFSEYEIINKKKINNLSLYESDIEKENKMFVFVIMLDNNPIGFTYNIKDAQNIMFKKTEEIKNKFFLDYRVFIETKFNKTIISGVHNFRICTYDEVLHVLKISKIYNL